MMCLQFASCMVSYDAVASYDGFRPGLKGFEKVLVPYDVYVAGVMVNTRCL